MKLKLTYFLLLTLLLLNGHNSVTALQQAQHAKESIRPVENRNGPLFFSSSDDVQPLDTLISDDDDDESRSAKKKSFPSGNFTALIHSLFQLQDQHFIKSSSAFQRNLCYSAFDRYILHCTLKI